jgi:CRP/FNR family transcriptional regulator, dissimilatory nitrate respiration regulator
MGTFYQTRDRFSAGNRDGKKLGERLNYPCAIKAPWHTNGGLNRVIQSIEAELRKIGVERKLGKNELLFAAGDEARGFYYVLAGELRAYKMDENGRQFEIARFREGDYLGEVVLFARGNFPVFAEAVIPARVLFLNGERILREISVNSALALFFLNLLAKKCLILSRRIESLSLQSVRERLIQYFYSQCPGSGCQRFFILKMKKGDLAKQLGTVGETLSRTFRQLQKERLIQVSGRKIKILNCPALRKEIAGLAEV